MEILLIENVQHLGIRGDVVNVKDGYARNFLLPRKMALPVTAGNKRQIELEKVRAEKLRAKELSDAKSLCEKLEAISLAVSKKAGENGHLFGSVTNADVAEMFKAKGFTLDRREITVPPHQGCRHLRRGRAPLQRRAREGEPRSQRRRGRRVGPAHPIPTCGRALRGPGRTGVSMPAGNPTPHL